MDLRFDDTQPFAVRELDGMGIAVPVAMAGEIHPMPGSGKACNIAESGILASCRVGKGRVTILADAALFEFPEGEGEHRDVLTQLVARARSEEHTSELQSPMRSSYAVFFLQKKMKHEHIVTHTNKH